MNVNRLSLSRLELSELRFKGEDAPPWRGGIQGVKKCIQGVKKPQQTMRGWRVVTQPNFNVPNTIFYGRFHLSHTLLLVPGDYFLYNLLLSY